MKKNCLGCCCFCFSSTSRVCVCTLFCILYIWCVCVFQGDASRCREAKGAVLAFLIIFNTVTQSEPTLLKILLQCLWTHSYRFIHLFRGPLFIVALSLVSKMGKIHLVLSIAAENGNKMEHYLIQITTKKECIVLTLSLLETSPTQQHIPNSPVKLFCQANGKHSRVCRSIFFMPSVLS